MIGWWLRGVDRADGVSAVEARGVGAGVARGVYADGRGDRVGAGAGPVAAASAGAGGVAEDLPPVGLLPAPPISQDHDPCWRAGPVIQGPTRRQDQLSWSWDS